MEHPKIINKDNVIVAYLNNLTECTISEEINGAYTLSFIAILDDLKTQFLYVEDNLIEVKGDLFKPLIIEELHAEDNELTVSVYCEHISYNLLETEFETFNYPYTTATEVMLKCLQGTDFNFTGTDVTLKTDINYQEESNAKQISIAIANNWKAELQYHRYNIQLWKKRGANRGVDFRFGKNIRGITKTVDRSKRDEAGNATVSYEIEVVELKHLEEYKDLEYFELGDTVRVIDDMLNLEIQARIVSRVYDVLTDTNVEVTLGNILDDIRGSLSGIKDDINKVQTNVNGVTDRIDKDSPDWDKIKGITNNLGNVITSKLEGKIKTSQNIIENSTGTVKFTDNGIMIHDQPTESASNWAMRLSAGGWQISDRKDGAGAWVWTTMGTGAGIVAESIVAGTLSGIKIDGVEITGTTVNGGTLNGVAINGGSIVIGSKSSGSYIDMQPNSPLNVYENNVNQIQMWTSNLGGYLFLNRPDGQTAFRVQGLGNSVNGCQMHLGNTDGKMEIFGNELLFYGTGGGNFYAKADGYFTGDLGCGGMKTAIVDTETYGKRALYSEESDRLYFNTKGVESTVNGKCIIKIDDVFFETIEPNSVSKYIVNVTPYADARIWVKQVFDKYIIIESDVDCDFSYNIQCIRKGFDGVYLEEQVKKATVREG